MERLQQTIAKEISFSGIGLHSGKEVNLKLKPARENHGIKFVRTDLQNSPAISAIFQRVVDTSLATVLGNDGAIVSTIEHLMASLAGLGIDNIIVEMDSYEVPIMDGSAAEFTSFINKAGIEKQNEPKYFFVVKKEIKISEDGKSVHIEPASELRITCTIDFNHPLLKKQTFSIDINKDTFEKEISRARTFGFIQEIDYLKRYGLAKGGSLDNAIVIDKETILNEGGLRYENEFVRHKILDCIGDFSLLGMPIIGHINIFKSGHAFHHAFLKEFFEKKSHWETKTMPE